MLKLDDFLSELEVFLRELGSLFLDLNFFMVFTDICTILYINL